MLNKSLKNNTWCFVVTLCWGCTALKLHTMEMYHDFLKTLAVKGIRSRKIYQFVDCRRIQGACSQHQI